MVMELAIGCILLVFSIIYFVQQLKWANEQKKRIGKWEEQVGDGQTSDNN